MKKTTILSIGCNRKLAKDVGILNLPEGLTCPGATPLCKRVCYSAKATRMYKAAAAKRQNNLLLSHHPDFAMHLAGEIQDLELDKVRFHEAGDVYDQVYLGKLYDVCRMQPATQFLMYTKSFHLDWRGMPTNLSRYWSVDKTTPTRIPVGPRAYLVAKGDQPPVPPRAPGTPAVTCTHTKARHYCGDECTICWEGMMDVYFLQH